MMKSLNIKIPLSIAKEMDDRAQLNPDYISTFIKNNLWAVEGNKELEKPITEMAYNYTFKIDSDLHKTIKLISLKVDLPMNELIGRLLQVYYKGTYHIDSVVGEDE